MKSHQYATKRRLTNICCLVVSLAFVKLVFAAYVMAGGELFEFTSAKKELSPKAAIIAQAQRSRAGLSPHSLESAQLSASVSQNASVSGEMKNIAPVSTARVSFLPKGQESDMAKNAHSTSQIAEQSANIQNEQGIKTNAITGKKLMPVSALASATDSAQKISQKTKRSEQVSSDAVLAKASAVTASVTRAQMRASLLEQAFSKNAQDDPKALEGVETQKSNYISQAPVVKQQNDKVKTQEKSSFFSFVGTANAAEEPYIRPDENLDVPIPAPTVSSYSSPDSLEYKQSELNRKEEELLALQQQMNSRMEELNKLEGRIGTMVQGANNMQDDKYKHLINTYTSMKAKKAAQALTTLDEEIAVRILNGMKPKQSGEIFSYMDSVQAARLSEAMTELQM